jgi:hypothetical protein
MAEHEFCIGETSEWYTPASIFDALGLTFDLDPAHPGLDSKYYGARHGHVPWLERFIAHANGVGVFRAYTLSDWWHALMPQVELILFPKGKTKFVRPDGSIGMSPGHGTALIGMGTVACEALQRSGLGMIWDRRNELRR